MPVVMRKHLEGLLVECHFECHRNRKIGKSRQTNENAGENWTVVTRGIEILTKIGRFVRPQQSPKGTLSLGQDDRCLDTSAALGGPDSKERATGPSSNNISALGSGYVEQCRWTALPAPFDPFVQNRQHDERQEG